MPPNGAPKNLTITNPLVLYRSLIATNRIKPDPAQHRLALHLQKLYETLKDYEPTIEYRQKLHQLSRTVNQLQPHEQRDPSPSANHDQPPIVASRTLSLWTALLEKRQHRDSLSLTRVLTSHDAAMAMQSPKGLMLHGEVGTGKTMLIDLFADCLPNRKKRRWHFNTFMLDTISRLENLRRFRTLQNRHAAPMGLVGLNAGLSDEYPLLTLARDLIETSPILFLDEFQFPDRAASKILSNLFTAFFQLGGVLIATSNRMPDELAKAAGMEFQRPAGRFGRWGLRNSGWARAKHDGPGQRGEFAMFLEVLKSRCEVWEMEGKKDYRRLEENPASSNSAGFSAAAESVTQQSHTAARAAVTRTSSTTLGSTEATDARPILPMYYLAHTSEPTLASILHEITDTDMSEPIPWAPATLTVYSRPLPVPRQYHGVALFTFDQLCGSTLGPADYVSIASNFHTVCVTDVPVLSFLLKNEARRFITALDAMYECRCRLLISVADVRDGNTRNTVTPDELFFPETLPPKGATPGTQLNTHPDPSYDPTHSETYSEIHQDLTSPFRPNISSYSSGSALPDDALEDDPPTQLWRDSRSGSSEERKEQPRSGPDFTNLSGLTGEDEKFAVKRARSRIWEMCSERWWTRGLEQDSTALASHASQPSWWRPLPKELRHWERTAAETVVSQRQSLVSSPPLAPQAKITEQRIPSSSPFRTSLDSPPVISWTHIWGTGVQWGKRAGIWGKGVEGYEERMKEKKKQREAEQDGSGGTKNNSR